ncbi:universal stress protein [Salinimicrobium sediminilitoris]|uniref:universal stress protein n=1 Tax=Salinimicrobium sediminilitoris TaxID=2876715 RepID=UPI001E3D5CAC|nr:universal stress protein [Salinimicrobium sediminilitoris]MCC8358655.1 universal stress protein [Salinimicrobium sediminilitoris]
MKKVLIAVDYNPVSEKVAQKGYELAKNLNAEVCLIHVLDDVGFYGAHYPTFMGYDGYSGMGPDLDVAMEMRNIAEEFLEKAQKHLNDPQVKTHLAEGDTAKSIMAYGEEWGASMLVMGTHSHSVLEKLLLGTVAEKVLEKTKIPVYLVPVKEK